VTASCINSTAPTGPNQFPPLPFVPANAKASALTVQDGIVYTTTSSSCGSAPDGVWAIDLNEADPNRLRLRPKALSPVSADLLSAWMGPCYVQTSEALVALSPKDLKLKQSFTAPGGASAPVVFAWNKKELVASVGKDGRLYLLDAERLDAERLGGEPAIPDRAGSRHPGRALELGRRRLDALGSGSRQQCHCRLQAGSAETASQC